MMIGIIKNLITLIQIQNIFVIRYAYFCVNDSRVNQHVRYSLQIKNKQYESIKNCKLFRNCYNTFFRQHDYFEYHINNCTKMIVNKWCR